MIPLTRKIFWVLAEILSFLSFHFCRQANHVRFEADYYVPLCHPDGNVVDRNVWVLNLLIMAPERSSVRDCVTLELILNGLNIQEFPEHIEPEDMDHFDSTDAE